ncbi:MAG: type II toxin-antitoxin system Phd/YefM family antitoxin [Cyclonatronaceae bacterium]
MKIYTYSQARQQFAEVLERAGNEGEVLIKRRDGRMYSIRPAQIRESPLDVEGIDVNMTRDEIIRYIRETRER